MELPKIVSESEWQAARDDLLAKEKEATRAGDALAAERRRLPMVEFSTDYRFEGPDGEAGLLDLFEGRSQLIVYHAWFPEDDEDMCNGCAMVADQIPELAHLNHRDTTLAFVSRAPQGKIDAMKRRMGWSFPWYTVIGTEFQEKLETTEYFALDVFLRDGDDVYLTYATRGRGVEALGSVWTFLDLTPLGRQEDWEDTPEGRPQTSRYQWWRFHDDYEESAAAPSG